MQFGPIGVFDSGVGGLSVLRSCSESMPNERFVYLADKANMPYGTKSVCEIKQAALNCVDVLVAMGCKAVVVACNTATVSAIDSIRKLYAGRVIVGLEPAIKPCLRELGKNGYAVALVTVATKNSAKFERLTADCRDKIVALEQPELAMLIENNTKNVNLLKPYVFEMLKKHRNAEAVILGCSHYTYITGLIREFYGGRIKIYDGADGAAARLESMLSEAGIRAPNEQVGSTRFFSTVKRRCLGC